MTSIDASMRPALHAEIPTLSHPEAFALRAEETVSDDLAEVDCLQSRPFSRFQERQRHHRHGPHRCSVLQRLLPLPARTHQGARHPPRACPSPPSGSSGRRRRTPPPPPPSTSTARPSRPPRSSRRSAGRASPETSRSNEPSGSSASTSSVLRTPSTFCAPASSRSFARA